MDFRLIVTQVVYDREAQIGKESISQFARRGNTAKKARINPGPRHIGLPLQVAPYTTNA